MPEQNLKPHDNYKGDPAELDKYRTYDRLEIQRVLRDLARQGELVTVYFSGGRDFVLTSVLDVDAEAGRVYLELGADQSANERLLKVGRAQFVSSHNRVRVQFAIETVESDRRNGTPVFAVPFPESMVRIQRREFYRLNTPVAQPIYCRLPVNGEAVDVVVVDISLGGVGLLEPPEGHPLNLGAGDIIDGCHIDLPEEGLIETSLEIRSAFDYTTRSGRVQRRIGCRFLHLTPAMNAQIQRYIHRVELERRRKARGEL